jgi:hypothetical protein
MAMKDATAKDWFNCFVRKTVAFRTKLGAGMEEGIQQFCPTDEEMIQYTERWLADTREYRRLGHGDEKYIDEDGGDGKDDIRATESEMRYKMLNFLDQETFPMVEMFGQIDTHDEPTIYQDMDYGRLLDFPYNGGVAIYQSKMLDILAKTCDNLHTPVRAFVATLLVAEVEKWMTKFVRKYIVKGHAI